MIIQHNIAAINSYRNLGTNQSSLNKNLEKLSSGYRINRAGDDAAGLAISESMRSQVNGLNQAVNNAEDAIGLIKTAEGAMTEVHSMLQRMTTLVTQAANGTYNSVSRSNIQSEIDQLNQEINRIAANTDFNGIKPLSNQTSMLKMTFQIGPSSEETIHLTSQNLTSVGTIMTNVQGIDVSSGATNAANIQSANEAIKTLKTAIDAVSSLRATYGAAQNRLEHTVNNLEVTSENITDAESRIRDTDMADEITAFTKNNILLQASQSMLSQANAVPQSVLSLLQ